MNRLDHIITEIANQEVPEAEAAQAAGRVRNKLFASLAIVPDRIRGCADYQTLIPFYLKRTLSAGRMLLLQDHTRECVACRHALEQARSGAAPMLTRPVTPPSRSIPRGWAIAAMLTLTLGVAAFIGKELLMPASGMASVQTVSGYLYAVSDQGSTPIFSGREIPDGQRIRTARNSTAIIRLGDGSLVEMNERSELWLSRAGGGNAIRLDRGDIIVQAARQRKGTLDVLTADCTVSVRGTIFSVNRGTKGSRVTVVEGSVNVAQGARSQLLKPGEQVTTSAAVEKTSADEAISWSRDSTRYLALLGEFSIIKKGIDALPPRDLRHDANLLPYLPQDTILYAAMPNLGSTLTEAQRLFNERLQVSEVLKTWWAEQKDGPKLQQMIDKLRRFSDYLGNEVVLSISGNYEGTYSKPLILAEVKRPGLEAFLNAEIRALEGQGSTHLPQVVSLSARPANETLNPRSRRDSQRRGSNAESGTTDGPMLIGVSDKIVAIAFSQEQLDAVASSLADPSTDPNGLLENVRDAYQRGAGWLLCVDMEHIERSLVNKGEGRPKLPTGLDNMRYLIVERKDVSGKTESQATLTFRGQRNGMAAWLAAPAAMGSLDYVSPNATLVVSMTLAQPQSMLHDMLTSWAQQNPEFQQTLDEFHNNTGLSLSPALGEPLGGEITFAIDGPLLPLPSWKLIAEVYSPERLQANIEQLIAALNQKAPAGGKLTLAHEQSGGRTFYTLTSEQISYEIDYVYVDGYIVIAPNRSLLTRAIQNRDTGFVLTSAESFRSQLPSDGHLNFSAIIYHNLGTALTSLANQVGSLSGATPDQQRSVKALAANTSSGLIYAYGQPDRITVASAGSFLGLDLNTLAIPSIIGRTIGPHSGAGQNQ